ncbi:MAG TPA: M28 family peptidase, partial [Thermoanaerobaculia bacterium]|nr:M28 family peptidase [Thermoanaerobaculia bacterium]
MIPLSAQSPPPSGPAGSRSWARQTTPLALALLLAAAAFLIVLARYQPPPARPATAPAQEFSALRAEAVLRTILGNEEPHPVGSAADARVRRAILTELTRLGYEPHVEKGFACSYDGVCAEVQNVLARLEGRQRGETVLLAAHYDSVPAGPGASDDGSGVASILEIARALKAGPPPLHPVVYLIDEGEEAGLLGAVE